MRSHYSDPGTEQLAGLNCQPGLRLGGGQVSLHPQPAGTQRASQGAGSHEGGGNCESGSSFEHVSI